MTRKKQHLSATLLEQLAYVYVARYATSTGKLRNYLHRKLAFGEWVDDASPDIEGLIHKFVQRGFVDDSLYAEARARDLANRGYGVNRISAALFQAGIDAELGAEIRTSYSETALDSALIFARKRKFGPFADVQADHQKRQKQIAAFLRAGHDIKIARKILDLDEEFVQRLGINRK